MFRQIIEDTLFTTEIADECFQHINGGSFQNDYSFLSTLRALVAPRIPSGESIQLDFRRSSYSQDSLVGHSSVKSAFRHILPDMDSLNDGRIIIHNFSSSLGSNNEAWFSAVEQSFVGAYSGWERIEKVTDFFKKSFNVACFVRPASKNVVIFTTNMDIRKMHYLQCSILAFLPWYFNPKDGISSIEMELVQSLREREPNKYEECIRKIAEQYDFRTQRIRRLLHGFEQSYEREEINRVRAVIEDMIHRINDLNSRIAESLKTKAESEIHLLGLETKIAQSGDDSELMEYFLCNKKLSLSSVDGTDITFVVKDYLTYFDEDMAKKVIENESSYVYYPDDMDDADEIIPVDDMKMLMSAIFIEQKLKIKFCAAFRFVINGGVSAISGYGYGSEFNDYMPNTHLDRYHCLGNYGLAINELLARRDYVGAIEQCAASCKSLNFADSPVMNEFMLRLYGISDYNNSNHCIELPDGTVMSPKEAIEWLKTQEANNE